MTNQRLERWLSRESAQRPAVVIGTSVTGLSYLRSLGRRGIPTLLLDTPGDPGLPSRYECTIALPRVEKRPEVWLDLLVSAAQRLRLRPVLHVATDQHLLFVGQHAEELERLYDFLIPPLSTLTAIIDKRRQYELASAAGVPIPRTVFPESAGEAMKLVAETLSYPCLLKPYESHVGRPHLGFRKNAVVENPRTLRSEFDRLAGHGVPCMVQEIVPGGDDALCGYLAFWGSDGREVAWITKQKLRQYPTLYGDGSYQRTVDLPRVAELSRRFLAALGYVGVGSVEFKYDARDDSYRLTELNARAESGNELAVAAGVDLPSIAHTYLLGCTAISAQPRWGVYWIHELRDLRTLLRRGVGEPAAAREWIRSLSRADAFALGAWDDPAPLLGAFAGVALAKVGRALGLRT